ncbi:MAG TPA: fatty acid desaturase, partial [Bacteroidia bacterium]|nr:fatty acid desaturase [Bacteroidia bacterium]
MRTAPGKYLIEKTRPLACEDRALSWLLTISTLLLMLVFLAGTIWNFHWTGKLVCSVAFALLAGRMFVIYHDHQHRAILTKSVAADVLMTLYGLYMLAPASIWKRSHNYHHKNNSKLFSSSIGSYPIMTVQKFIIATPAEQRSYLLVRHPVTILLGYLTMFAWGMCIGSFLVNPRKHIDSLFAILLHICAYV